MTLLTLAGLVGLVLLAALGMFLVYAATRPAEFEHGRSQVIDASPEAIFPHINNLSDFDRWNPFAENPEKMNLHYGDKTEGPGAQSLWDGGGSAGRLTITDTTFPTRIAMRLEMQKPIGCDNHIVFALTPEAGGTRVSWTMGGRNGFAGKVMSTIFDGDKMCGQAFEKGLADLKTRVENDRKPALHVA